MSSLLKYCGACFSPNRARTSLTTLTVSSLPLRSIREIPGGSRCKIESRMVLCSSGRREARDALAAIEACEQIGRREEAMQLYEMALERALLPDEIKGELDLHELSSAVARVAVANVLARVRRGEAEFPQNGLGIITGRGKHSEGNMPIIKPEIEAMLSSPEFTKLNAAVPKSNPGMLFVRADNLRVWMGSTDSGNVVLG